MKITLAPSDDVDAFPDEMARVLSAVGHPEALVTDESQVFDFLMNFATPSPENVAAMEKAFGRPVRIAQISPEDQAEIQASNDTVLAGLAELMGRPVTGGEYLAALARELHSQIIPTTRH